MTFVPVYRQFELSFQPVRQARQYAFASYLTFHIDVYIICVTNEPVSTPFKLFIKFIEENV